MKRRNIIFIILLCIVAYFTCTSLHKVTIEEHVENLMKEEDLNKRAKIAYTLADSLSTHAVDLLFGLLPDSKAESALSDMIYQYNEIYNNDTDKRVKVIECIKYIASLKNINNTNFTNVQINLITRSLQLSSSNDMQDAIIETIDDYGEKGMENIISSWKLNRESTGLKNAVLHYDEKSINYLADLIGIDSTSEDLIARIGEPALNSMLEKMRSENRNIRFSAGDALVKMNFYHPEAVSILTDALKNGGLSTVARNYPFYIRLGKEGTEDVLLAALNETFDKKMCLDFLNCGSKYLDEGARRIAEENGFYVTSEIGHYDGPKWGDEN